MKIFDKIKRIIAWIIGLFTKHKKEVVKGFAAIGGAAALAGLGADIHANKVNNKALAIRNEAITRYNDSNEQTEIVMETLGNLQIKIIETFEPFIEAWEMIQELPTALANKLAKFSVPN